MIAPFPTANEVAQALVMACRRFEEDPVAVVQDGKATSRARLIALEALRLAFPSASRAGLARALGFANPEGKSPLVSVAQAKHRGWWREFIVDEIVGELVADQYGSQAE